MKNVSSKIKITLIAAIAVLLIGAIMFGIFGFNNTADYKNGYELNVSVEANIGDAANVVKTNTEAYLKDKGVSYAAYSVEKLDDGGTLAFQFTSDIAEKIVVADLETKIEEAMASSEILSGLDVTVKYYQIKNFIPADSLYILLAAGLSLLAAFIYSLIMQKLSGAATVLGTSVLSVLLFIALTVVSRIPAEPFVFATSLSAAVLAAVFACGMVGRFNESVKNVGNAKKSFATLADEGTYSSTLRLSFISIAFAVLGIAFIAIGPSYVRFLGLQILLAVISAFFSAYFFTGVIWSGCKALKKDRKPTQKSVAEENN